MAKGKNEQKYKRCYLELNNTYFDGLLSRDIIISESLRMKNKAGACYFNVFSNGIIEPFEICLSKLYLNKYPSEIVVVLLHEMIHIKLKSNLHNLDFLREVERLYTTFGIKVPIIGNSLS